MLTVLGTRPEIIRLSRIIPALDVVAEHVLVHTGQNAAANLSQLLFDQLGVRAPDVHLGIDTSSLGRQLASLFEGFEAVLDAHRPERVLILGDTNSGLVAFNCQRRGIPVYHMEAGNRCYDDRVPEEVNRRVIDHCSSILLPYTHRSAANLVREGIARHRIFVTGNPINEVLEHYRPAIDASDALSRLELRAGGYLIATMHRAESVDREDVLAGLCRALVRVADLYELPLILSVHPRVERRLTDGVFAGTRVRAIPAPGFFDFVSLQQHAALVMTDSGTVQEECAILRVPVLTIRDTTERPETVEAGSNIIASTDPDRICAAARFVHTRGGRAEWSTPPEYLERNVSDKIVRMMLSNFSGDVGSSLRPVLPDAGCP